MCFSELESNDNYEPIALFLHAFLIRNSDFANVILSKQSVLLIRDVDWVYGTAAAVPVDCILKKIADAWNRALQLNNLRRERPCFDQQSIGLLEQGYFALEGFADRMRETEGVQRILVLPVSFDSSTIGHVERINLSTILEENELREE